MLYSGAVTSAPAGERTERIAAIDGLRALAFLLVFAFHSWQFAGAPDIPVISTVVAQNIRPDFFVVLTGSLVQGGIFPLFGLLNVGYGVYLLVAGPAQARKFQQAREAYHRRRAAVSPEQFLDPEDRPG